MENHTHPTKTKSQAYSYIRFSSPQQMQGDSLRRQTEASEEYAAAHGLRLDYSLNLRDLGVSAYRGRNSTEGALAGFMTANPQHPKGPNLPDIDSMIEFQRQSPNNSPSSTIVSTQTKQATRQQSRHAVLRNPQEECHQGGAAHEKGEPRRAALNGYEERSRSSERDGGTLDRSLWH
jgi:Resolvase, N terminal domain